MGAGYKKQSKSFIGGSGTQQAANQTRYLHPFGSTPLPADIDVRMCVQFACNITNFCIRSNVPPGAGETYIMTVYLNGVPTALTLEIAGAVVVEAGPDVDVVALVPGDFISIQDVTSLNAGAVYASWSLEVNR